ncbi:hypothetical protein Ddc_15259 [Ditylenchus destructor]|nr:hypothetical protein Ddc_15259 [Ditylenchus destructor]
MSDQDPFIILLRLLHAADEAIARENFAEPQEHSANSTPTVPPPAIDLTTQPSSIPERLAQTESNPDDKAPGSSHPTKTHSSKANHRAPILATKHSRVIKKGAKKHKCKESETLELRAKQMEKAGKVKVTPKSEDQ